MATEVESSVGYTDQSFDSELDGDGAQSDSEPRPGILKHSLPPIDTSLAITADPSSQGPKTPMSARQKGRKIGHRRVDDTGNVTYKKRPTSELMAAIQLGIGQSVGGLSSKPERDILMQDFAVVNSVFFPSEGSNMTPAHHLSDFRFKTYAPLAFRYFRETFGIQPDDFLLSLCDEGLQELSNPGASGSIFYITQDDEFIIKTVQHKEAEFLQKLLPGYYMNLNQNPRTLLPKFYGLYCYQCGGKNIRFTVMNNLLPSWVKLHEKYDLKGSSYKRKASKKESAKACPTLKDLDFMENHPQGIFLEKDMYDALILKTMLRDCRVLESFKIMDYSLLVGFYNLDQAAREKGLTSFSTEEGPEPYSSIPNSTPQVMNDPPSDQQSNAALARAKSIRNRVAQYSTAMESIQAPVEPDLESEDIPPGGIPTRNAKGERLLMYLGIIDVLQSYRLKKKIEHSFKSLVIDGDTISVHRPSFYAQRFQNFFANTVFQKIPTPDQKFPGVTSLKHSPSKRKGNVPGRNTKLHTLSESSESERRSIQDRYQRTVSFSDEASAPIPGTTGGPPDLLPENSTPPPTFAEAVSTRVGPTEAHTSYNDNSATTVSVVKKQMVFSSPHNGSGDRSYDHRRTSDSLSQTADQDESISMSYLTSRRHSPPLSISDSTPTHTEYTEGTPSFTASSPSCSSLVLDSQPNEQEVSHSPLSLSPERKVMVLTSHRPVPTADPLYTGTPQPQSQETDPHLESDEMT